jgi:tRNA(Ile)-lysidine synthase
MVYDVKNPLITQIENFCQQHGIEKHYLIAFSGGLDSHVLLHLFVSVKQLLGLNLRALHVNHNLSVNAASWAEHCAQVCNSLEIELLQLSVNAKAINGKSPEDTARQLRYAAIMQTLAAQDILITAHHQDDQAETLLLQLCRGAGPKGLAAMPAQKKFGKGILARPLLSFRREQLHEYAKAHDLQWIEDESNANSVFARNFMRHSILPVLQQRWPAISKTLARSAANCAEAQNLLDEMAAQDVLAAQGSTPDTLSVSSILMLSAPRQRLALRFWLRSLGFAVPGTLKLQQIQQDMLLARQDRQPRVEWTDVVLRRHGNDLIAANPLVAHDVTQVITWPYPQPLVLAGLGELKGKPVIGSGLAADLANVTVRFRQGGEVCRLPSRVGRHDLKKLFQSWRVPVWQRERIPLVYVGEELAAIVGWSISEGFKAKAGEPGYELELALLNNQINN